ncbi:MAG TPA: hypothetical protein VGD81_17745 [Opitutaceae bacterium]
MSTTSRNTKHLTTVVDAWTNLRPTKSFAGMTLEGFKVTIAPAVDARLELAHLRQQVLAAIVKRDNADREAMRSLGRVVAAVVADEAEGNDGVLYAAMGYVRKSDRRSGLTRRKATPSEATGLSEAA